MKKRIFSMLLALAMVLAMMPMAFAAGTVLENQLAAKLAGLSNEVNVPATMEMSQNNGSTWKEGLITLKTEEMNDPIDFRATLNTNPIKGAIKEWYEAAKAVIEAVAGNDATRKNAWLAKFEEYNVTGSFTVEIKFPAQFTGAELNEHLVENRNDMYGFNEEAKELFMETSRRVVTSGGMKTIIITIAIKDFFPGDTDKTGIAEQDLYEGVTVDRGNGKTDYLNELTYTVEGVVPGAFTGTITTSGKMTGNTVIKIGPSADSTDKVFFYSNQKVPVEAKLRKYVAPQSEPEDYKITFNIDGNTDEVAPMYARGTVKANVLPLPEKPGYRFEGWYRDSELTNKITDSINVYSDITVYGHWVSDVLLTDDHFAYIIGYPDETVRPLRNITREESTMIFYRLLRDESRDAIFTLENTFSDIAKERWSNSAISTMSNGYYVVGRPDGTFDPEAPITRAEFATMAVRFASLMDTSGVSFNDIEGHWAERYILKAAKAGWIKGYPDGSFKPDAYITRAEAMTLVNNVLMRHVNESGLHADTRKWIDMDGTEWYYYIVLEATNTHDFTRQVDGYNENWTAILPNKTWK
ncbi:MAG: hypothetical protein E7598_04465 [Ruminococcaceae bacterium]|nr:hypothetical protein [Oscillospiraceae bacterium]